MRRARVRDGGGRWRPRAARVSGQPRPRPAAYNCPWRGGGLSPSQRPPRLAHAPSSAGTPVRDSLHPGVSLAVPGLVTPAAAARVTVPLAERPRRGARRVFGACGLCFGDLCQCLPIGITLLCVNAAPHSKTSHSVRRGRCGDSAAGGRPKPSGQPCLEVCAALPYTLSLTYTHPDYTLIM